MATYMGSPQRTACSSQAVIRTIAIRKVLQFFVRSRTRGITTPMKKIDHLFQRITKDKLIIYYLLQAHVFESELKCVSFFVNFDKSQMPKVTFRHLSFQLAPKSISLISDCRSVVYETAKVSSQHSAPSIISLYLYHNR